jgi:hypothetical protein
VKVPAAPARHAARVLSANHITVAPTARVLPVPALPTLVRLTAQQLLQQGWGLGYDGILRSPRDRNLLNT